jgi:two-component system sensor histidine kinase ChiS
LRPSCASVVSCVGKTRSRRWSCANPPLPHCARDESDAAFEALMHVAQLATRGAEAVLAERALDEASLLLAKVTDPLASQRIARRRGQLAYGAGRRAEALGRFLEALAIARSVADVKAIAISENDVGVVYWQMGDYGAALGHLQASLAAKEANNDRDLGSTLANIGGLYTELGDNERAADILRRALQLHQAEGSPVAIGTTLEELAMVEAAVGDLDAARRGMDAAWQLYLDNNATRERLRLALRRAGLEAEHAPELAPLWVGRAREAGRQLGRNELLAADLITARLARTNAEFETAFASLQRAVRVEVDAEPTLALEAQAELARLAELLQRPNQALGFLREHLRLARQLSESRHSQRLDALRVRLDLTLAESERDRLLRQSELQMSEIARRRAQTLVVAAGALLILAGLILTFQRRLYRQRLAAEAQRQTLERSIREARSAAAALSADLRSTEWLLERQSSPALIFDASGKVRAITFMAAELLSRSAEDMRGRALAEVLGAAAADWAQQQVERESLGGDASLPTPVEQEFDVTPEASGVAIPLLLRCQRLDLEEEFGVLVLAREVQPVGDVEAALKPAVESVARPESPDAFRAQLVTLMQASLDLWERMTRKTRIDLAERSGVWRITIDEGRLRVRALDRYLSLDTLPEKPRWREVLRTAYFVLSELELSVEQRRELEILIESVLAWTRKRA